MDVIWQSNFAELSHPRKKTMKKQFTICCAIALAGCSAAPSEGDIEDFMRAKFASCQNIVLKDVKKTNGYAEDDYYAVEFTYSLKVKEPKKLREKKELLIQETEHQARASVTNQELARLVSDLEHEMQKLDWAGYPKTNEFDRLYPHLPIEERTSLLHAAQAEYVRNPPAEIQQKRQALRAQKDALEAQHESSSGYQIYGNVWSVAENFYLAGCSGSARRFMQPLVNAPRAAANAHNDPTRWFDEYDIQMTAQVPMRKTENGWRALSDR